MDALRSIFEIAHSGVKAQSARLQVVAENIANAKTTGSTRNDAPYTRQIVSFQSEVDRATGSRLVKVGERRNDTRPFPLELDPQHPAADDRGYVKMPNVNPMLEMADLREANRSYQANLQSIRSARELYSMTIDLLKG